MNINNKVTIFILIFLFIKVIQSSEPYCKVDNNFQNTKLFTTVGETQDYYLDDYFQGFNLKYSLVAEDGEEVSNISIGDNKYQIYDSFDFKSENDQPFTFPIAQDTYLHSDGTAYISILTENSDGFYDVYVGKGEKTITPTFKTINLPIVNGVQCLGINKISDSIDVVDCIIIGSGSTQHRCQNYFYIISSVGTHKITHEAVNNCYLNQRPFSRKTVKQQSINSAGIEQIFLFQGIPFDMQRAKFTEENTKISYLNIFRYVTDQPDKYPNGRIQINPPITANTFELDENLQIADFDILGNIFYILDHKNGVIFFEYKANEITWYKHYFQPKNILFKVKRWGLSLNYNGSTIQMLIAESNQIKEYHLDFIEDEPKLLLSYPLEHMLTGTIKMDSNSDFILVQYGRLLNIYNRGNINRKLLKAQVENADLFYLWYSNNMYIINKSGVFEYFLQAPTLNISGKKAQEQGKNIKIKATSKDFFNKKSCILDLNSVIIQDKFTKKAFSTNYPHHIEFSYQSSYQTYIPLEIFWVGPNLNYKAFHVLQNEKQNKFLGLTETGDKHTIYEDLPKLATVHFVQEDTKNQWFYTEIIASKKNPQTFIQLHQNYDNQLHIFNCYSEIEEPSNINCGLPTINEDLEGRISLVSFGEWGYQQNIMAIVFQDKEQFINFYYIEGEKAGQKWFQMDINTLKTRNIVIDIELKDNSLYCIIQEKTSRFIAIYSYTHDILLRETINSQTIQNWPSIVKSSEWYPQQIYSNEYHKNVIFVQSRVQVYIISTESHTPMYLDLIPLRTEIGAVIDVTPRSFIIAYQDDVIEDFSLQNLNWVSFKGRFEYPTYGYEFVYPFSIATGEHTGMIYILAYEPQTTNLKCMIFQSGQPSIKTLYKIVDIEDNIPIKTNDFSISVGGNENVDYVFIEYGEKKFYIRTPVQPKLIITPHVSNQNLYVDNIDLQLLVTEWSGEYQAVLHEVKIVNGQTDVIVNESIIRQEIPETLYCNGKESAIFKYQTIEWWSGSVINVDLLCEPNQEICDEGIISIEGPVIQDKLEKDAHSLKSIIDIKYNKKSQQLFIFNQETNAETGEYENIIRIYDNSLTYIETYNQINGIFGCQHMDLVEDKDHNLQNILVYCYDFGSSVKWDLYIVSKDIIKKIYLPNVNIEKGQTQYFEDILYINNQSNDSHQGLYVFDISKATDIKNEEEEIPQAKQLQHFNYLKPYLDQNLKITSFIVTYELASDLENNYVKLILSNSPEDDDKDIVPFLVFLDLNKKNNYNVDKINDQYKVQQLNFDTFVIQHRQFLNEQTQIKYLKFKEVQPKADETIKIQIFVMTDNTAIYEIDLMFSFNTKDQLGSTNFLEENSKIIAAYNNYGINIPYSQIELYESNVVVPYFNDITKRTTLTFYESFYVYQQNKNDEQNIPLHSIKGGHKYQQTFEEGKNSKLSYAILRKPNGNISIVSNDISPQEKLISMEYKAERLNIITNGQFEEQQISLQLVSDYSNKSFITTKINPDKEITPTDDSDDIGWKIALGITIPVVLIGGCVAFYFLYYKKKKQGEFYTLNENPTSEAGYSLQQPLKKV